MKHRPAMSGRKTSTRGTPNPVTERYEQQLRPFDYKAEHQKIAERCMQEDLERILATSDADEETLGIYRRQLELLKQRKREVEHWEEKLDQ